MAKIYALKAVSTAKLPNFQLKPTDVLHCFLTLSSAASFGISQLGMAAEDKRYSWAIPHPEYPDRQFGIGMSFVRYEIDMSNAMIQKMITNQHDPCRPTNYIGTIQPNGVQMPQVHSYMIGRDDGGKLQVYPPDTDLAALVQERKEKCEEKRDAALKRMEEKVANAERNAQKMHENALKYQEGKKELFDNPVDIAGINLIYRQIDWIRSNPPYAEFTRNLEASFKRRYSKYEIEDPSGMRAAHEALVDVYEQIRKAAVKRDDFETATFAHNTVQAASAYLTAIATEKHLTEEHDVRNVASREELEAFGINPDNGFGYNGYDNDFDER